MYDLNRSARRIGVGIVCGIVRGDLAVFLTNVVTLCLLLFLIGIKLTEERRRKARSGDCRIWSTMINIPNWGRANLLQAMTSIRDFAVAVPMAIEAGVARLRPVSCWPAIRRFRADAG